MRAATVVGKGSRNVVYAGVAFALACGGRTISVGETGNDDSSASAATGTSASRDGASGGGTVPGARGEPPLRGAMTEGGAAMATPARGVEIETASTTSTTTAMATENTVARGTPPPSDRGRAPSRGGGDGGGASDDDVADSGLPELTPSCIDGRAGADETDVDCGGATDCLRREVGDDCRVDEDCASSWCNAGLCDEPSCFDAIRNGNEEDVDCGGACEPCNPGCTCASDDDCPSRVCQACVCLPPTCEDARQNGDETGVDCGGATCDPCPG